MAGRFFVSWCLSGYFHEKMKNLARRKALFNLPDVFIISYPKSGRTWLRVLLGKWMCLTYGIPDDQMLFTSPLSARCRIPIIALSHDGAEMEIIKSYAELSADKSGFASKKVLLLSRDIKDTLVSAYFQISRRDRLFDGSISEFLASDHFGVKKILTFYKNWCLGKNIPKAFLNVRYEDLRLHTEETLGEILHFIGIEAAAPETIREALAFASFDNMKRLETAGAFPSPILAPQNPEESESFKVRKGKIGGYVDYLSASDIAYIDEMEKEWGCEFTRPRLPIPGLKEPGHSL